MDQDPWFWNAGDVEDFFRNHAAHTVPEGQRARLPPSDAFFEALQNEGVTGDCLLTAIDTAALRDEYGVTSAMTRSAVWSCICKLRARSAGYAAQHGLPTVQTQTPQSLPPPNLPGTPVPDPLNRAVAPVEETHTDLRPGENTRSGEYQVQDEQGRKRRKLNLLKPEQTITKTVTAKQPENYLPDAEVSLDKIFYGDTAYGEQIDHLPADGTITVLEADHDGDLDDTDFQFQHQDKANGESEFVYKHMQYMFRNPELVNLQRQGRDALAALPYRQQQSSTRSATVIQYTAERQTSPVAFKENAAYLNSTVPEKHAEAGGEWGFLMDKYATEEGYVLPAYGESETALSESKLTSEASDSGSMAEVSDAADDFNVERAADFIDKKINQFADEFIEGVPTLGRKKAWTTWKKMKGSRTLRQELIASAKAHIEHLQSRLRKQKAWLLESRWKSESSLEKVCGNLKVTVEDIEEQKWMIDVWGRKQEPWHAKHTKKTLTHGEPKHQSRTERDAVDRLVIPDADRFSVSPPPPGPDDEAAGAVATKDIIYEADDEEFHTPVTTPEPEQLSPDAAIGAQEAASDAEQDSTSFIVGHDTEAITGGEESDGAYLPSRPFTDGENSARDQEANAGSPSDDLPSPSIFISNRVKREPIPSTLSTKRIMSIDLTGDSPSSEAPTPSSKKRGKSMLNKSRFEDPNNAGATEIDEWEYSYLVRNGDRKRILLKILRDAGPDKREALHQRYLSLQKSGFVRELKTTLGHMRVEGLTELEDDRDDSMRLVAGVYLRWHYPELLTNATLVDIDWASALADSQISAFSTMLWGLLRMKNTPKFNSPKPSSSAAPGSSSLNALVLSSSDTEMAKWKERTPHKKRKKEVQRSQTAQGTRRRAFERLERANLAESQPTADSSQLAVIIETDPANSSVEINSLRGETEPAINIARKIATKMKKHQIEGARFLWREITATDDDEGHGCVLAHTMGLGKTMQTIAFLAAANEAAQSDRSSVRSQLPKHLRLEKMRGVRALRIIILCPAGLIQNWNREISMWVSKKLGHVFCMESTVRPADRSSVVGEWMRTGGALIVGYDLFRSMVNPGTDKRKKVPVSEEEADDLAKNFLEGPDIVVADEAHNLRNEKSGIAMAVKRFKTESKIALTGTPMSNDVLEIYALVSWVSPDYLGDPAEFRSIFAEPIKEGLYADSTRYEQRKSIMKLQILHKEIQPKVSRANIEALRGSIPGKVEFVIFVSLQERQKELYRRYIQAVKAFIDTDKRDDGTQKTSQVVFMSMLAVLTLLTGHPSCFRDKLLEPPKVKKAKSGKDAQTDGTETESDAGGATPSTTSGSATPLHPEFTTAEQIQDLDAAKIADAHVSAQGLTPQTVCHILGGDGGDIGFDPGLSSKITVFMSLLHSSLGVSDSVIVFSQRLGMLDYLEQLLKDEDILYGRIDGSNMKDRMPLLEQFKDGEFNVMLVSTKAGGIGLNMQCANRVFIFDSGFNPTYEEQAIGRAYRLGQQKPVYVYRFVAAGTFETNIYNKQLFKTSLAQRVVDKKNPRRTAERNTREYLYEPKDVPEQDISEHISKDPQVLGKLLQQHGTGGGKFDTMIRDVKTMETLTEEIMDEPLDQEEQKAVDQETEARKQRPRGKKAAAMMAANAVAGFSSTMPPPAMRAPGYMPPPSPAPNVMPPPSTIAGPRDRPKPHPYGGLPTPRNRIF